MSRPPAGLIAITGARFHSRISSGSRTFRKERSQIRVNIFSEKTSDFRTRSGSQIGPLLWRLGPPGARTYPPQVATIRPGTAFKTLDLGIPQTIPKSSILKAVSGPKVATRGGYVQAPGGPNRHAAGPISALGLGRARTREDFRK